MRKVYTVRVVVARDHELSSCHFYIFCSHLGWRGVEEEWRYMYGVYLQG
jgi:hypothetical protein